MHTFGRKIYLHTSLAHTVGHLQLHVDIEIWSFKVTFTSDAVVSHTPRMAVVGWAMIMTASTFKAPNSMSEFDNLQIKFIS